MTRRALIAVVTFGVAVVALGPIALLVLVSFARQWFWPSLLPAEWSAGGWAYVFTGASGIGEAMALSFGIAVAVMAVAVAVALPAARALAYHEFRFKQAVLFGIVLPVLAPPLASAMGIHSMFLRLGWVDSITAVIAVHLVPAIPYATLILMGSFSRFDREYEAQARTLGAGPIEVFRHVTIPAILPGLAVASSFAFLISWSQYLLTLLIGGGRVLTLPLQLVAFQRGGDIAVSAALSLVFVLPALLAFGLASRGMEDHG